MHHWILTSSARTKTFVILSKWTVYYFSMTRQFQVDNFTIMSPNSSFYDPVRKIINIAVDHKTNRFYGAYVMLLLCYQACNN